MNTKEQEEGITAQQQLNDPGQEGSNNSAEESALQPNAEESVGQQNQGIEPQGEENGTDNVDETDTEQPS